MTLKRIVLLVPTPVNIFLRNQLGHKPNAHFLKSIDALQRKTHFTTHGQHLNDSGRQVFANLLADSINKIFDTSCAQIFETTQVYCPTITSIDSFSTLLTENENQTEPDFDHSMPPPSLTQTNPTSKDLTLDDIMCKLSQVQ